MFSLHGKGISVSCTFRDYFKTELPARTTIQTVMCKDKHIKTAITAFFFLAIFCGQDCNNHSKCLPWGKKLNAGHFHFL